MIENNLDIIKSEIFQLVKQYYNLYKQKDVFIPGESWVTFGGRVYDENEIIAAIDASLEFWLTEGRFSREFRELFGKYLGVRHVHLVNSGSSANLVCFSALTSPKLSDRRLLPGDEVISVASAFPTTVNPIIQNGMVPVFVDMDIGTYNANAEQLKAAITSNTKAIFLAHTLGNALPLDIIMDLVSKHNLWFIEDSCDALGSSYNGKMLGTFGHAAAFSFYPPHHMTMGEGGAVVTNNDELAPLLNSFRNWGRDCWCEPGKDNTCGKRFSIKMGDLPLGYDHKHIFSHIGYNLKPTDIQAAIGVEQIKKLPGFVKARKQNFTKIYEGLKKHEDIFILPEAYPGADVSWFGFLLTVREDAGFERIDIVKFLEAHKVRTRMLFEGNLLKHPGYKDIRYRQVSDLKNTNIIMERTFWIGVYPGLTDSMIDYMLSLFDKFRASK